MGCGNLVPQNKQNKHFTPFYISNAELCIEKQYKIYKVIIYYNMETEYCDKCGRNCDGVHSNKVNNAETEIQKMVKIIESYGEKVVDEIIKQIYNNRHLKCEKV